MFPESFDVDIYIKHSDLYHMNHEELINHYKKHGKNEGRQCSLVYDRVSLIKNIDTQKVDCLEIGPFDCPVLLGDKVHYFDVLDQDGLKKRSREINRPFPESNVPFIHYIDVNGDLSIVDKKFDVVLSCHSIEHQLDFIQHLNNVSNLLNAGGYYVVIVPDKRYIFDHFIKESTIADIIEQNIHKSNLHSVKSVIEHRALTCHNDSGRHWMNDHGVQTYITNPESILNAIKQYQHSVETNCYLDVHSLQFTPESFESIIHILNEAKYINLSFYKIYPTLKNSCEFYAILKKNE